MFWRRAASSTEVCNFATVILEDEARTRAWALTQALRRGENVGPLGGVPTR